MTVSFAKGDMFACRAEAVVNTVNCVGVMGKGVALEFKRRWPANFQAYRRLCEAGGLRPGRMFVFELSDMFEPMGRRFLVNFPTKDHWRDPSRIEWIEAGLGDLAAFLVRAKVRDVVMPPLGCGNGGLDWKAVRPLIEERLSPLEGVAVTVFEP